MYDGVSPPDKWSSDPRLHQVPVPASRYRGYRLLYVGRRCKPKTGACSVLLCETHYHISLRVSLYSAVWIVTTSCTMPVKSVRTTRTRYLILWYEGSVLYSIQQLYCRSPVVLAVMSAGTNQHCCIIKTSSYILARYILQQHGLITSVERLVGDKSVALPS